MILTRTLLLPGEETNSGDTRGDGIAWFFQFIVYFFVLHGAAESQYNSNIRWGGMEYLRGVQAAGLGAGLITSALVWATSSFAELSATRLGFLFL
ncbi:hypothetical protein [Candidatus Villigracilis affinis]|uniref:hypothetical protein n=1 Tax=Candidatus Villigracilis affinis TaxID=3140682 RepID=UPI002A1DCDE6|nr:hypothetical protein [Anaerolineales bacterium]